MNEFFRPPERISRKIKMLIYGKSGTGKTWYALEAPKPLAIIDLEGGSSIYHSKAADFGGFDRLSTASIKDIDAAVKSLECDTHYQSIVIDPITIYYELLQEAYQEKRIKKSGNDDAPLAMKDWGDIKRRYKSLMTRLINIDKNMILIAREKELTQEIGGQHTVIGSKEDAEKSTTYLPDVVLQFEILKKKRMCRVIKDRTSQHETGSVIEIPKFSSWNVIVGKIENTIRSDNATIENAETVAKLDDEQPAQYVTPEIFSKYILRINSLKNSFEAKAWWEKHKNEIKLQMNDTDVKELYQMVLDKSATTKPKEVKNV